MRAADRDGTMKGTIKETELAVAYEDDVISIEGSSYFPPSTVDFARLAASDTLYICPWKGRAQYYDVIIDGVRHHDAAWSYPSPKSSAVGLVGQNFASFVAFDPAQVKVERVDGSPTQGV